MTQGTTATATISERAMLVDFTCRLWGARRKDADAEETVQKAHGIRADMGRFTKSLILPEHLRPLTSFATASRDEARRRTAPWLDTGERILSALGYLDFVHDFNQRKDHWENVLLADFYAHYPEYVAEARYLLNGLFNPRDYPSQSRILDHFAFGFRVFGLPSAEAADFRVTLGDAETARIRRQIQRSVDEAMERAMSDVADRIRDVVGAMVNSLSGYTGGRKGAFRDTLVSNVRALVEILPSLNITGNAKLAEITDRMSRKLCAHEAEVLRESAEARQETAAAAESILAQLGDFIA